MARIEQLPPNLDLRLIAGRQFVLSVTCTGATVGSPTVTIKTAAGDAYTTDPGVPTVSVAAGVITVGFSAADTALLNGTTRPRSYQWALSATLDGAGPFDLLAGIISAMPIGSSGQSSASSATLTFTAGVTAVALAVTVGGGGGGASALGDLTDVAITSPSNGQVLKYNGTAWINAADATGGGGANITAYGAVASPTVDNRAAIQAAIDAVASAGGGTVFIPAGTYGLGRVSTDQATKYALLLKTGVSLRGEGPASVLRPLDTVGNDMPIIRFDSGATDLEVADLTIDGNRTRVSASLRGAAEDEGIDAKNNQRVRIRNVRIIECAGDAIDLDDSRDVIIDGCIMSDNSGNAVHIAGAGGVTTFGWTTIANCLSTRNAFDRKANAPALAALEAAAFDLKGSYVTVVGCVSDADARGIIVRSASRCVVMGNIVRRAGGDVAASAEPAIWVDDASALNVTINGCTIEGIASSGVNGDGVRVSAGERVTVSGCSFHQCYNGVRVAGGGDVNITGNIVTSAVNAGIAFTAVSASRSWSVQSNTIRVAVFGVYVDAIAAPGVIAGNVIDAASQRGIDLRQATTTGVVVQGNRVLAGATDGLRMLNAPTNCRIMHNDLVGSSAALVTSGTGHIIRHNVLNGVYTDV